MLPDRRPLLLGPAALALAALLAGAPAAFATPVQFLPVGDPLEAELRVLDLYEPPPGGTRFTLPHLDSRPLQLFELMGAGRSGPAASPLRGARAIAIARLERALARDADSTFASGSSEHSTPRLIQSAYPGDERLEVSAGLEGESDWTSTGGQSSHQWVDGSGVHLRMGVQFGQWLAYSHLFFGELKGVRAFSDALVSGTDLAASTEETYLAYSHGTQWSAQIGRSRWQWGPGEEATLLLSGTSVPLTGLMLHGRIAPLHADGFLFNATVEPGRGEQLAAHRLEWQPRGWARLGFTETARYHANGWQGLYLAGILPYAVVQRLLDQDSRASGDTLRNNVMLGADASLRIADGLRLYGELLIDDLHARTAEIPNKYGWQFGLAGVGDVRGTRISWDTEYTRLSQYVYTSYFGRVYSAQDQPTGYPTGPDARRLRARLTWDPNVDWQVSVVAAQTDKGQGSLLTPFVPGDPVPDVGELSGTPERTRTLEGTLRWWPASGVDLSVRAGRQWIDDAGHVAGVATDAWTGSLAVRLVR